MDYLLDTNIVSYVLKRKSTILDKKLREVSREGKEVFISCLTYYEVKRGLIFVNAKRQLAEFNQFFRKYEVLLIDDIEVIEQACKIHLDLKRRGNRLEDADILIAATAIVQGLILVSHDSDMARIPELTLEDWLETES